MALFDFISDFFNGLDLTRNWVEQPATPLEFDLDSCTLGGVTSGSRFEKLNWLGRAESRRKYKNGGQNFMWFTKGLAIEVKDDCCRCLMLSFEPAGTSRYQPFPGTLVRHGQQFHIEAASSESDVRQRVGEPTRRTEDENVIETLFYRIGDNEVRFDFDEDGKLAEMYCVEAESEAGE